MEFWFHKAGAMHTVEMGRNVVGYRMKTERPLNCYISSHELQIYSKKTPFLAAYLRSIQDALAIGGRIVIR